MRSALLRPRRVSETLIDAAAAAAAVTPGTISKAIAAASSASISSSSRPNTPGSPDFSRTTRAPLRACATISALMSACRHDGPPGSLPTSIRTAPVRASARTPAPTSRSWITTSAVASRAWAFSVSKPGSPGPAPTSATEGAAPGAGAVERGALAMARSSKISVALYLGYFP